MRSYSLIPHTNPRREMRYISEAKTISVNNKFSRQLNEARNSRSAKKEYDINRNIYREKYRESESVRRTKDVNHGQTNIQYIVKASSESMTPKRARKEREKVRQRNKESFYIQRAAALLKSCLDNFSIMCLKSVK